MCGIAGFSKSQLDCAAARDILEDMSRLIAHRGPDGVGYYLDRGAALAHRRLSIIDLNGGCQPMQTKDGSLAVVFNGEIYNYRALTEELLAAGHCFTTKSDTEVLLHGYEQWGKALPQHLQGMFAFVIRDKAQDLLFGARDLFGIKPLYLYHSAASGQLMFSSEIKAFLAHPDFTPELNTARVADFFSMEYLPDDDTLFAGVQQLAPAHSFLWQNGQLHFQRYESINFSVDNSLSAEEWAAKIRATFSESVRAHCVADVEAGCFLSSGVDSAFTTACVANDIPQVKSFSVGFAEPGCSELGPAAEVSRALGVPNFACTVGAQDFLHAARQIQWFSDEPMPNPSAVPLFFLARLARRQVKVVLSGEGADELFGGYPLYQREAMFHRYAALFPLSLRRGLAGLACLPAATHLPGRNFLRLGVLEPWQRAARADYVFSPSGRQRLLMPQYCASKPLPQEQFHHWFRLAQQAGAADGPALLQWVDLHTWMPRDILLKADRMSMANGLELRVPFLDRSVLQLALRLPGRFRTTPRQSKPALRLAAASVIPADTARRKKLGFPVPLAGWLRTSLYTEALRRQMDSPSARQFFCRTEWERLLAEHQSGCCSHMTQLWSVFCFLQWYELFFEGGWHNL